MFMADVKQVIKDREENRVTTEMLEILDEMLNDYEVKHFFTLPDGKDGIAFDDSHVANVYFEESDRMTFSLVYMLWFKTVRHVEDVKIANAMKKVSARFDVQ